MDMQEIYKRLEELIKEREKFGYISQAKQKEIEDLETQIWFDEQENRRNTYQFGY